MVKYYMLTMVAKCKAVEHTLDNDTHKLENDEHRPRTLIAVFISVKNEHNESVTGDMTDGIRT